MKTVLLDTHVLLWWLMSPKKLSREALAVIQDADVTVSVVSLWEMLIKGERGKLRLPEGSLAAHVQAEGLRLLPLRVEHVRAAAEVGGLRGNPHDRLIVGTARADRLLLLTRDAYILEHAAPVLGSLLMQA